MALSQEFKSEEVASAEGGNYFKPQSGSNQVRIISDIISGYELWYIDSEGSVKVKRQKTKFAPEVVARSKDKKQKPFAACVVFNRETKRGEEWVFTQRSIIDPIQSYINNPAWGNPKEYDIMIEKSGSNLDTKYNCTPNPKTPMDFLEQFSDYTETLEGLYSGEPMFSMGGDAPAETPSGGDFDPELGF